MISIEQFTFQFSLTSPPIFDKLTVQFERNSWTCLLGKSGCGKTTLLKRIAGFDAMDGIQTGNIYLGPNNAQYSREHLPIAYMGQQDLLFPWLDVLHNVCLEAYLRHGSITESQAKQATQLLHQLDLPNCLEKYPYQLSGGMRQRVAIARTLMQDKPIVLMDEPFAALDAVTRYELQNLVCQLLKNKTVLFITHDPQEALRIADRIVLMKGLPAKLYEVEFESDQCVPRDMNADLLEAQQQLIQQLTETRLEVVE